MSKMQSWVPWTVWDTVVNIQGICSGFGDEYNQRKAGFRHEVIDRQLAHAHKSLIDAAYDRAQFIDGRKKMMQDWVDYIGGLV